MRFYAFRGDKMRGKVAQFKRNETVPLSAFECVLFSSHLHSHVFHCGIYNSVFLFVMSVS